MRVQNKITLITGASQGIGAATARLLASEGAIVILTDIDVEAGEALAQEIGGIFYRLDVSSEADWRHVIETIKLLFNRLDVLVNNAGITGLERGPQDPEYCSLETFRKVHQINLEGVFLGCKHGIGLMKAKGGSIINLSSRSGIVGIPAASAYASTKAAIRNHTKSVALYCAQAGYPIRCNSLHPGAILTAMWDPMLGVAEDRQAKIEALGREIPLGHMGEALDVAYAVLYLASDESKYITGSEIVIDGGILAGSSASPRKS